MASLATLLSLLLGVFVFSMQTSGQRIPDRTSIIMYEMEQLMVDTAGINDNAFLHPIQPTCANYALDGGLVNDDNLGRQSAAQWIRNAFHDFNTANVFTGTGGLDASIGFEAHLGTNVGPMIHDSMFFFSFFVSDVISMADCVALGLVMAVGNCGGPTVPYRAGRIDATGPGPDIQCNPDSNITQTLGVFHQAGMTQEEGITLVACGHTMGGVHYSIFPDIVSNATVTPNNTDGRVQFDNTVAVHDYRTIHQYVTNTGNRGGPMVNSPNITVRSDYRLYNSDKNVTAKKLASSNEYYLKQCSKVMAKMIDTVPRGTTLTPEIVPEDVKYINVTLDLDWKGQETLNGAIRYLQKPGYAAAPKTVDITLVTRSGKLGPTVVGTTNSTYTGGSIFGPTTFYVFTLPFSSDLGLSGIRVLGHTLPLTDTFFIAHSLSSVSPELTMPDTPETYTFNTTAALLRENVTTLPSSLHATFSKAVVLDNAVGNRGVAKANYTLHYVGDAGPFAIYTGNHTSGNMTGNPELTSSSVDVVGEGLDIEILYYRLYFGVKGVPAV